MLRRNLSETDKTIHPFHSVVILSDSPIRLLQPSYYVVTLSQQPSTTPSTTADQFWELSGKGTLRQCCGSSGRTGFSKRRHSDRIGTKHQQFGRMVALFVAGEARYRARESSEVASGHVRSNRSWQCRNSGINGCISRFEEELGIQSKQGTEACGSRLAVKGLIECLSTVMKPK
ncbi:hypothetical protein TNIN_466691 [Trichonephila inaurata madagascariensis]|uniref:Uncharacterized protein n=1 Tax=Trichonephila inaurata madagascariensis TaxID=2747483 RepID=A0A8X7CGZ3_9ARAC|nr:hypothetical protein TNIN_466691 [Trichonephila inaurata madagascariensis]